MARPETEVAALDPRCSEVDKGVGGLLRNILQKTGRRVTQLASLVFLFATVHATDAQCHPCMQEDVKTGTLASGTPVSFQLKGSQQHYGVSGLVLFQTDFSKLSFQIGSPIWIAVKSEKPDRYRRLIGQVFIGDDDRQTWLQGGLLSSGQALVAGTGSSPECTAEMLKAERLAEKRKLGIWVKEGVEFPATDVETLAAKSGHFVIVRGKVLSVGNRKTRLYLNFGRKWSQDFTALIAKKGKGAFKGDLEKLTQLKGATVRIRGIVEIRGGPMIRVTNEAQIEIDGR